MAKDRDLGDLVRRAEAGEAGARDELARRLEPHVRAAIGGHLGNDLRRRVDADDILQSTLSMALGEIGRVEFRGEREFLAWLRTVAERRLLMAARRHRADMRDVGRERPLDAARDAPDRHTNPSDGAARNEAKEHVQEALVRLTPEERRVLDLRSWQGLTFQEIAVAMGLADKHAARRLYQKALRDMGERLEIERDRPSEAGP